MVEDGRGVEWRSFIVVGAVVVVVIVARAECDAPSPEKVNEWSCCEFAGVCSPLPAISLSLPLSGAMTSIWRIHSILQPLLASRARVPLFAAAGATRPH